MAVTDEAGATSADDSRGSGGCCDRAASLTRGCPGIAIVAITSTATPASVTMCPRLDCRGRVGRVTGTVTLAGTDSTAACSSTAGVLSGTTFLLAIGFVGRGLFAGFFTRGRFSVSTSADTSNVHRTRRPDWRGESLIGCFGTQPKAQLTCRPNLARRSRDRRSGPYRCVSRLSTVAAMSQVYGAGGEAKARLESYGSAGNPEIHSGVTYSGRCTMAGRSGLDIRQLGWAQFWLLTVTLGGLLGVIAFVLLVHAYR